jgi:hypothetical protein
MSLWYVLELPVKMVLVFAAVFVLSAVIQWAARNLTALNDALNREE